MSDKKKDEQVYNATENFDKVGSFENKSYNGGSGVGSKSNVEKLAQDYVNSNYDSFTKGTDYASLAKRYSAQGRQAMDDTIGQMAARTGGLASSWAASAGQQAYGGWMEKLEDAARSLYNDQMNEKMSKLGVAQGLYDRDYGEFVDNRNFNYGIYKDNVENAKWKDTRGYQQNQDAKEAAEDFKNSIYDAAYWGNANWDDFKYNEYGITEAEFNRIVKSAEGARGDDTYERNLAAADADELKAQEEQKRAQNEVMMMWAAGVEPTDEQLEAAGWADKNESGGYATYDTGETDDDGNPIKSTLNNKGQAYYKQATYKEPVDFTTTEKYKGITSNIQGMIEGGEEPEEVFAFVKGLFDSGEIDDAQLSDIQTYCLWRGIDLSSFLYGGTE